MATTTQGQDQAQDRRRAREERGVRSTRTVQATAERLPSAPRQRRPALAALAVLLIVGGAALAGLLALRADERVPVLVANIRIPAGVQITEELVGTTPVASEGTLLIPATQLDALVGRYARVEIQEGQLIDSEMVTRTPALEPGGVALGAALGPGRMPATGLSPGDIVDLVRVVDGEGTVILEDVRVSSVQEPESTAAGAMTRVTFIVDRDDAADVAAVGASEELAAVLVSRGTPLEQDD